MEHHAAADATVTEMSDDYMDAKFLTCDTSNRDTRERRKGVQSRCHGAAVAKVHKEHTKLAPLTVRMRESVEEGLKRPIDAASKGFQMLAKMGYKTGQGLGRDGGGRTEPIPIHFNDGKEGIGVLQHKIEKLQEKLEEGRKHEYSFRDRMKGKFEDKQNERDLLRARQTIEVLDTRKDIPRHDMWFPEKPKDDPIIESKYGSARVEIIDEFLALGVSEALLQALAYLRSAHLHCLYCGCDYETQTEMEENCPGKHRDDH